MNKAQWFWWGIRPRKWFVKRWPQEWGLGTFLWFSVHAGGLEIRMWHGQKVQDKLIKERVEKQA